MELSPVAPIPDNDDSTGRANLRADDNHPAISSQDSTPSICRICRGEGTSAEPLFYPCKCSGSIKYVHQDCLMEWLSHSQKKHCELCKTSFRFTKLYAPDMPQSLPVHVFLEHMARYLIRNMLVWLRAAVTISVWVCWLPYFMRSVWSFMFWVSDEGLGTGSILARFNISNASDPNVLSTLISAAGGQSPASPLFAPTTTSIAEAESLRQSLTGYGVSGLIVNFLLGSLGMPMTFNASGLGEYAYKGMTLRDMNTTATSASLLSDVNVLRNLTRSPTVNRTVVSVLEGQLITILVIVCFILVILVRDYVVQHQPEINMQAAFAEVENELPAPEAPPLLQNDAGPQPEPEASDDSGEETLHEWIPNRSRRNRHPRTGTEQAEQNAEPANTSESSGQSLSVPSAIDPLSSVSPLPEVDAVGGYHFQENEPPSSQASVVEYLRIFRRAGGDSKKILQIIEDEGLEEKLAYWLDLARRSIRDADDPTNVPSRASQSDTVVGPPLPGTFTFGADSSSGAFTPGSSGEQSHGDVADAQDESEARKSKGKERAIVGQFPLYETPATLGTDPFIGSSRPRSVSEGPHPNASANPLGSNSWSFAALPRQGPEDPECDASPQPAIPERFIFSGRISPPPSTDAGPEGLSDIKEESNGSAEVVNDAGQISGTHAEVSNPDVAALATVAQVDGPGPQDAPVQEVPVQEGIEQRGLVGRVANFMWGGLDEHQQAHELQNDQPVQEEVQDDPWVDVPVDDGANDEAAEDAEDAGENGARPGFNAEAVEEMDDFEGVMELIGMRGPIAGLFQNAIFCAVLVSVTIFTCIFIPYNVGRISLWIAAHPMRLVRMLFEVSKLIQDLTIMVAGLVSWCTLNLVDMLATLVGGSVKGQIVIARKATWGFWMGARGRIFEYVFLDFPMSASEMQNFSAISHQALITVKGNVAMIVSKIGALAIMLGGGGRGFFADTETLMARLATTATSISHGIAIIPSLLLNPNTWVIDLSEPVEQTPVDPELAYWSGLDRFWAILAGYATVFLLSAMYLKRGSPFSRGNMMHAWEAGVIDTLHQASGIMKVILVISIEMLVFPLYCGLLLDMALLPLFANATFKSRLLFTYNFPLTSVFVHWFVGTGYMFHFALFVSMCRKIMRPGVLYFIRDPDDPGFHPVRDVLERNLTTQLRKILFSAFVYGALVIICLGGVVWGLSFTLPGVLPIHYSSNEPILEFPVDLLFYNFLIPLAVKFFKPSDGLHIMYTWWFRKCARGLRLTFFLFGERRIDEEGVLHLPTESSDETRTYQSYLLELNEENRVIPKTWRDTFDGGHAKPIAPLTRREMRVLRHKKIHLVKSGELVESGHFVRAPASDRVKIPKGTQVFLTVSERDHRSDGNPEDDMYASDQYQVVYIPPSFRSRVFMFILLLWIFAAVTGVGFTIIPLIFGRRIFKVLIPEHIQTNDVYAFSIGICLLGSLAYALLNLQGLKRKVGDFFSAYQDDAAEGKIGGRVFATLVHGAKLLYVYFFVLVVFPLMASTLMELYVTIPLHTYMNPISATSVEASESPSEHANQPSIRVIQSWTLGLLYLKLGSKLITTMLPDTRVALAVRTVMRRGWLKPDIGVLTRAFVLPGLALAAAAIFGPPLGTKLLLDHNFISRIVPDLNEATEAARMASIYRQSYPIAAFSALLLRHAFGIIKIVNGWTSSIRDEAYLIGERLHNFGAAAAGSKKTVGASWRAGGTRL